MAMGDNRLQGPVAFANDPLFQGADTHPCIDHQIKIPTAHVPDIAAHEIGDAGFLDKANPIREAQGGKRHGPYQSAPALT